MGDALVWLQAHWDDLLKLWAYVIAGCSIVVKLTPTVSDDHAMLWLIKFMGKWGALNKYGPTPTERPDPGPS